MTSIKKISLAAITAAIIIFSNAGLATAQSVNVALGKTTIQSGNINVSWAKPTDGLADLAVDGDTNGSGPNNRVTHTDCGTQLSSGACLGSVNPWWQVDLGADFQINRVQIWNRTDCCQDRLDNYRIWVKSTNGNWDNFIPGNGLHRFDPGEGNPIIFQGNTTARFVRVQIVNPNAILSLAEVQVFAPQSSPIGSAGGGGADQQFWDTIKNSQNASDFQGYLNAFPNGQFAALARFKMGQLPQANPGNPGGGGSPVGGTNADQQFWDTVKNSQNASDFQGYLNAFPNGQFAALARFKMGQLPQNNPGNSGGGNVGASNADQQFWDTVKNSQNATDFQGYLNAFPNGQFAALARFKMSQLPSGNPGIPGVGTNSDQQFWDSVKNSQRASDFQGYLNAFPNGQFAALARFKMSQLPPINPGNPGPIGSPGNLGQSRNAAFLNQVAATNRAKLPLTVGDIQLFDSFSICQSGCQQSDGNNESVIVRGRTPQIAKQNTNIGQIEQSLKSALLKGYCGSPEQQNNVTFGVDVDDMFNQKIGNFFINSRDCNGFSGTTGGTGSISTSTSRNAAFLNNSAAESRATLPITLGQIQLFDAVSHCQSGCQVADNTESVTIRAKTPNLSRQNTNIRQIDQALRPLLTKTYCGTPEQKRNIPMGVDVDDMFNQNIGNFFLDSRDCGGNAGVSTGSSGSTGFQQVIAAAQPGSLSEIARARSFFVVSNDFNIKSKIASQLTKALPQLRAATSEQTADFLIGFEMTDRTTGLVTPNDPANPNLKGELIVFTLIPAQNGRPESVRILFRVTKERGFGVFSATPDENAAKEFAKQFAKVII